ncbi:MAG: CopG family transcriptional regulator [Candidatus Marinimicrobia bacterium]|nr:CopG family transcriptional regulator [Candidatus Neomarinimicrobiota bacterium]
MSKTVTLRLEENTYEKFKRLAESDNRTMSNFIETSVLRYIENNNFVDEFEMEEIESNIDLNKSLRRAQKDMKLKKGKFVE